MRLLSFNRIVSMVTTAYKTRFNKNYFEQTAWQENQLICGIDEVGRGCLAGPVVVCAAILFANKISPLLKDSKLMTPEERIKAYGWIIKNSWHAVSLVHHRSIDKYNIYKATLIAMKRAYLQLATKISQKPSLIITDAMPLQLINTAYENTQVYYFPFGERKSSSIAAASIIAKVTRDRLISTVYTTAVPGYELEQHKGYATPAHKKLIRSIGPSIIHRMNFVKTVLEDSNKTTQLNLYNTINNIQSNLTT